MSARDRQDWLEHKLFILNALDRLEKLHKECGKKNEASIEALSLKIQALQHKAIKWGAIAGSIPLFITLIQAYLKFHNIL